MSKSGSIDPDIQRLIYLAYGGADSLLANDNFGYYNEIKDICTFGDEDVADTLLASLIKGGCLKTIATLALDFRDEYLSLCAVLDGEFYSDFDPSEVK